LTKRSNKIWKIEIGARVRQQKLIIWSKRNLASAARIKASKNTTANTFARNSSSPMIRLSCMNSGKNTALISAATTTSSTLSVILNIASSLPLYSVNVPPTISVSASGMSNGTRSSFPCAEMTDTANPGRFTKIKNGFWW